MQSTTPNILGFNATQNLDLSRVDTSPERSFTMSDGTRLAAEVTVEEDGDDELLITEHPVQQGATITDHAVKRPCELRIRLGWSAAYLADQGSDVRAIYDEILRLQATRVPFQVFTGKRQYQNMLVQSLRTHTDQKLEHTFLADIGLREVILVNTNVSSGAVYGFTAGTQAHPQTTTPTVEAGPTNPLPASLTPAQLNQAIGISPPVGPLT